MNTVTTYENVASVECRPESFDIWCRGICSHRESVRGGLEEALKDAKKSCEYFGFDWEKRVIVEEDPELGIAFDVPQKV